jgi:hypothetical protein
MKEGTSHLKTFRDIRSVNIKYTLLTIRLLTRLDLFMIQHSELFRSAQNNLGLFQRRKSHFNRPYSDQLESECI